VLRIIVCVALIVLLLSIDACKMPNDGYPVYMRIDTVALVTSPSEGWNTHNITDVWVEANADNLGVYEYPVEFPVLQENQIRFLFQAGVKANGFTSARVVYPFYAADTLTVDAKRLDKLNYKPTFRYRQGVNFVFNEDFEFGNQFSVFMDKASDGDVAYGNSSGKLQLGVSQTSKETQMASGVIIQGGGEVWAEFDYKSDASFEVGIYAGVDRYSKVVLFPKQTWSKLYLNLSQEVGYNSGSQFNLFFNLVKPDGATTANVWIDNVKILKF
jgi:hypothetical protein